MFINVKNWYLSCWQRESCSGFIRSFSFALPVICKCVPELPCTLTSSNPKALLCSNVSDIYVLLLKYLDKIFLYVHPWLIVAINSFAVKELVNSNLKTLFKLPKLPFYPSLSRKKTVKRRILFQMSNLWHNKITSAALNLGNLSLEYIKSFTLLFMAWSLARNLCAKRQKGVGGGDFAFSRP